MKKILILLISLFLISSCTPKWNSTTEVNCPCQVNSIDRRYSKASKSYFYEIKMTNMEGEWFTFYTESPDYKIGDNLK